MIVGTLSMILLYLGVIIYAIVDDILTMRRTHYQHYKTIEQQLTDAISMAYPHKRTLLMCAICKVVSSDTVVYPDPYSFAGLKPIVLCPDCHQKRMDAFHYNLDEGR